MIKEINIPTGWEKVKLDDLAIIERGRFSPRPRNDPQYYGGSIPFVQTGDISRSSIYINSYSQTLNQKGLSVSKLFPKSTILMTIAANIGDVAVLNFDSACPDSLVAFSSKKEVCNKWLFHKLKAMKNYFISLSTQNAQKNLSLEKIKPVKVLIPPLPEQEAIADILEKWDEAIETTTKLIETKTKKFEWLKNSLFDKEFKSYKESLSDYCSILKQDKISDVGDLKPLTVKLHCRGIEANERDIKITLSNKGRPYFRRFSGEFLIGRQNFHNGGFGIVPSKVDGFIASNAITSLDVNFDKLDTEYLFYFFSRKNYYLRIGHIMDGTGQKELSDKQIMHLPISVPEIKEQRKIVATLNTAKKEITILEEILAKYKNQKKGLMQNLLTGKIRVNNINSTN